jgi:polyribonucleotide nucleotidyltransferase
MFNVTEKKLKVGGKEITLEMGRIARQASGSVLVTCGDCQVLVAVTAAKKANPMQSFFPLSVDYIEKMYAAGRIPGGYVKRETRPSDREILVSRLIDRPIRPLFPESFMTETQVVATVLSHDPKVWPAPLAMLGTSLALHVSDIPFQGPIAGVRVGMKDGKFLINPSDEEVVSCDLEIVVAGTAEAILMVEAGANFVSEKNILDAIAAGHKVIQEICAVQDELRKKCGVEKRIVEEKNQAEPMQKAFDKKFGAGLKAAYKIAKKAERKEKIEEVRLKAAAEFVDANVSSSGADFAHVFENSCYKTMRQSIIKDNLRIDGRKTTDIRNIVCETAFLKRAHGSSLFTRGETQSIGVVTLGTSDDGQRSETLTNVLEEKHFMLHYNMPGYSVGEPKRLGSPGRREVGHGALAERALRSAMPHKLKFPYTVRVVSEITESNGSSSMASVCSGTLALLDAGVPISEPVAGIAMGLVLEGKDYAVLSDILGDEDALGDMDFKVAGGKSGITALQMDIKVGGISLEILKEALDQAKDGRMHILGKMTSVLGTPNDLSDLAPRVEQIKIKQDKMRDLIGPGGRNIKRIVSETGCKVDLDDSGVVSLASTNGKAAAKAKLMIQQLTSDPQVGEIYLGVVKKVADFGAFVEIKPGVEGLVHVSQVAATRVEKVEEVMNEGDQVMVKVIELDRTGRIKLSRKDALGKQPSEAIDALSAHG